MDLTTRLKKAILRNRQVLIFLSLLSVTAISQLASFLLRFEFVIPPTEVRHLAKGVALAAVIKLSVLYLRRQHRGFFGFSGLHDLGTVLTSSLFASTAFAAVMWVFDPRFPRSVYVLDFLLTTIAICILRVLVRFIRESKNQAVQAEHGVKNVLIYGAGVAGKSIVAESRVNASLGFRVIGFLDDAPHFQNEIVVGIPVLGAGADLHKVLERLENQGTSVDLIAVAMPSVEPEQLKKIVELCRASRIACRTLPGLSDLLGNRDLSLQLREINFEDLLGREKVVLDEISIRASIAGKTVMITGAAGSIGSDLAACVASFGPSKLILFDISESPLFQVDLSLRAAGYDEIVVPVIGDIRDYGQVDSVIADHGVQVIFHAAAFKHVPLVEEHVVQAAFNNVIGTYNVAEAAWNNGVESFTLISTDKAVRPTNFMGATKRAAEMIVSSYPRTGGTRFSAVRFGNVLGSNGSVVPTFKWQISRGGPVTVTHPEVTRYFMTIREAVQLVLQTTTMSTGSNVFVLDMGEPVKILDLARNVIRLAGFEPDVDIKIEFIGLRPGEKLYEELIAQSEHVVPTYHQKIKIFTGPAPSMDSIALWIRQLEEQIQVADAPGVVRSLADLVTDYMVSDRWNDCIRKRPAASERTAAKALAASSGVS